MKVIAFAAAALLLAAAAPAAPAAAQVPARLGPDWVAAQIREHGRIPEAVWPEVRGRAELVEVAVGLIEDAQRPMPLRVRAVFMLGAADHPRGDEYVAALVAREPRDAPLRWAGLIALGAGERPPAGPAAYDVLAEVLRTGSVQERISAAQSLGGVGSERGRQILRDRLPQETVQSVRLTIRDALAHRHGAGAPANP
jgi:hypothetical protein